jgi:predicted methyltransferase
MRFLPVLLVSCLGAAACKSTPAANAPTATATAPGAETPPADAAPDYTAIVAASDRDAADRALDAGRKPDALLAFMAVRPGMKVAEIGAGGGYTTELLARAVGEAGSVYAQNSPFILARFAEGPLTERLKKPVMTRVVRLDREFAEPFPPEVRDLDLVVNVLFYHDTVWMKVDREAMNRAIFQALKPGGSYVIVDHSSAPGKGLAEVETLHRIEESVLKGEIEQAGFRSVASADFLRNPQDPRDWSASPRFAGEQRGTSDRFVLRFEKP